MAKVGIIGGGQLAVMMIEASKSQKIQKILDAKDLSDFAIAVQTQNLDDPAALVADSLVLGEIDDAAITAELAKLVDVITFENEFVNIEKLQQLAGAKFIPSLKTLKPLLDKYVQRCYLQALKIPVPQFFPIFSEADLHSQPLEFPVVLKARRNGYDGQGTKIVDSEAELISAWKKMGQVPALIESKIDFQQELAIMVARTQTGECQLYPVVETYQQNQVCAHVIAPARISDAIAAQVQEIAKAIVSNLEAVGIFGIEFFLADGKVSVNEIAPRPHNSGHFTIEACHTSQFEQLLRIITALPMGEVTMRAPVAVMVNLLGYENAESDYGDIRRQLAQLPNTFVHWYGKNSARVGRKLGHVTVLAENYENIEKIIAEINLIWKSSQN